MITAISCCRLFFQNSALRRARDVVVAELVRGTQQHRLLGNVEGREVARIFTVLAHLASGSEYSRAFDRVC